MFHTLGEPGSVCIQIDRLCALSGLLTVCLVSGPWRVAFVVLYTTVGIQLELS